jgi:DNA-binding transcriptional LysR family regulator
VLHDIELRHLYSVIVLAEEMHFTRAAHRLRIAQPSLSKRIQQIERPHGVLLFARDKGRIVELTDAGRIFLDEARLAIFHAERALNLARAADRHSRDSLVVGYSPDADYAWVSSILATRPPSNAKVRIRLCTRFAMELVRDVLVGEMNLALVTAPTEERQLTAVPFARRPLYAVLPDSHRYARRKDLVLRDLADDEWILNAKQVHPTIHDAILETAKNEKIAPKDMHETFTEQQAVQLVVERAGVGIFTKPCAPDFRVDRFVVRPLLDASLRFDTSLVMRSSDDSKLTNEFARSFLRRFSRPGSAPKQGGAR